MKWGIVATASVAAAGLVAENASAQQTIACEESRIQIVRSENAMTCTRSPSRVNSSGYGSYVFYQIFGAAGPFTFSITAYFQETDISYWIPISSEKFLSRLQQFNRKTSSARSWGTVENLDAIRVLPFRPAELADACTGIYLPGPLNNRGGYRFYGLGYVCQQGVERMEPATIRDAVSRIVMK